MARLTRGAKQALRVQGGPNADAGVGSQVRELPQSVYAVQRDFSGGAWMVRDESQIPENGSAMLHGFELNANGSISRMKGFILQGRGPDARKITKFVVHPNPAYPEHYELLAFAEDRFTYGIHGFIPWLTWYNVPFATDKQLSTAVYGDTLLIQGGGSSLFARALASNSFTYVGWDGGSRSITVWAGRVWAGSTNIGGGYQARGIKWTGSADYDDVSGADAGYEILFDDIQENDYIQKLVPMNEQTLGIIMRRSIWVGRFTGDAFRPAHFVKLYDGVGALYQDTVQVTPIGVIFVSNEGVKVFDGASVRHLSTPIDDYFQSEDNDVEFHSFYEAHRERYWLLSPNGFSFIYDIKKNAWTSFKGGLEHIGIAISDSVTYQRPLIFLASEDRAALQTIGETYINGAGVVEDEAMDCEWRMRPIPADVLNRGAIVQRLDVVWRGFNNHFLGLRTDFDINGLAVLTAEPPSEFNYELSVLDMFRHVPNVVQPYVIADDYGNIEIEKVGVKYQLRGETRK